MPQRLELFYSNLNHENMKRRLFYIYKWSIGRREASREDYARWLTDLTSWFSNLTGVKISAKDIAENIKDMTSDQEITDEMLKDNHITQEEDVVPIDEMEPEELKEVGTADVAKVTPSGEVSVVADKVGAKTDQVAAEVLDAQKDKPPSAGETNLNKEKAASETSVSPAV